MIYVECSIRQSPSTLAAIFLYYIQDEIDDVLQRNEVAYLQSPYFENDDRN